MESIRKQLDKGLELALKNNPKSKDIYITGHSLGAAAATLYAAHVKRKFGKRPNFNRNIYLAALGSPRVGNKNFAKYATKLLGKSHIFNIEFMFDPVHHLPSVRMGFYHVGGGRFINFSSRKNYRIYHKKEKVKCYPFWKVFQTIKNHSKYKCIVSKKFCEKK